MNWFLQTPETSSPKLLANILDQCGSALKGGAAFAFASAQGIKLLFAEPKFSKLLSSAEFTLIVGLDAITDTSAVDELRKLKTKFPSFKPKLFLHSVGGSIFHPKTVWLKTSNGGVVLTGSGNLTSGGLRSNWEATSVQILTTSEFAEAEKVWDAWLKANAKQIVELDDAAAIKKAEANKAVRSKIRKILKKDGAVDDAELESEIDAVEVLVDDIDQDLLLHPTLIAEVPANGPRWKQVGFNLKTYEEFFGVAKGKKKYVRFYHVRPDGSLDEAEDRESVEVKSENYRFEVGAAAGLDYPKKGQPIIIFEKIGPDEFKYVLLMPPTSEHTAVQKYLDENYSETRAKRRVQVTLNDLNNVWPEAPFFL